MLGQVLGWGLLGCPCTVEQLPLQKRQVGLETEKRRMMLLPGGSDNFGRRDIEVLLLIPVLDDKDIKRLLILSMTININLASQTCWNQTY